MIALQFTKNNGPLSYLIRWVFNSPVSHFSLRIDNVVFHSNLKGAHVVLFSNFKKKSELIFMITKELGLEEEEKIWQALQPIEGRPWDFMAALFLGYHGLMYKLFKTPMPDSNNWGSRNAYLCTEVIEALGYDIKNLDMSDPNKLYLSLIRGET